MSMDFGIPSLRPDMLATAAPACTYAGGWLRSPASALCIWATHRFQRDQVRGATLGFFVDDRRFSALLQRPAQYARELAAFGWGAVVEPDFSVWRDDPLTLQLYSVYCMRALGRLYQEHGLPVIPNLTWGDARSYEFAFLGIPKGCPVAAVECRSVGAEPENRRLFAEGLAEAVQRLEPQCVIIYGGAGAKWLEPPPGPRYALLPSWSSERKAMRRSLEPNYRARHRQGHAPTLEAPPATEPEPQLS